MVHPVLELHGWQYEECSVWDKGVAHVAGNCIFVTTSDGWSLGVAHVAGNCNSKTIRGMPVVTEVAVRYTRRNRLPAENGETLPIKEWLRREWLRSGLPLHRSNEACGVANAATRKYLTRCHLWYFPPPEAVVRMADYCARHGRPAERPCFSLDGRSPVTEEAWSRLRAKWRHVHGVTNVWREPAVHGRERIRAGTGMAGLHANQKPLSLMARQILACTDEGDVVSEPFGGLCSASIAALRHGRRFFAAEVNRAYFEVAARRLEAERRGAANGPCSVTR